MMIAKSRNKLHFADSCEREKYSFFKQPHIKLMLGPLQSHPSICGISTIFAAFHLFSFRQKETTEVQDVNVLSIISNYR